MKKNGADTNRYRCLICGRALGPKNQDGLCGKHTRYRMKDDARPESRKLNPKRTEQ